MRSVIVLCLMLLAATPATHAAQSAPPVTPVTPSAVWQSAFLRPDCTPTPTPTPTATPPPNGAPLGQPNLVCNGQANYWEVTDTTTFACVLTACAGQHVRLFSNVDLLASVSGDQISYALQPRYVDLTATGATDYGANMVYLSYRGWMAAGDVVWDSGEGTPRDTTWNVPPTARELPTPGFRVFLPLVLR